VAKGGTGFGRQGTEAAGSVLTAAGKEELLGYQSFPSAGCRGAGGGFGSGQACEWRLGFVASHSLAGHGRARRAFAGLIRSKAIFA
jgi:hypothetical protein